MSSYQGKKAELAQQAPTTEEQKSESTELTDADLDKVAGGIIIINSKTAVSTNGVNTSILNGWSVPGSPD
jgi:hypothetical protein